MLHFAILEGWRLNHGSELPNAGRSGFFRGFSGQADFPWPCFAETVAEDLAFAGFLVALTHDDAPFARTRVLVRVGFPHLLVSSIADYFNCRLNFG